VPSNYGSTTEKNWKTKKIIETVHFGFGYFDLVSVLTEYFEAKLQKNG